MVTIVHHLPWFHLGHHAVASLLLKYMGVDVWQGQRIIMKMYSLRKHRSAKIYGRISVVFSSDTLSRLKYLNHSPRELLQRPSFS